MVMNSEVKLLQVLEAERSSWVVKFNVDGNNTTLFKLGSKDFFEERDSLIQVIKKHLELTKKHTIHLINMDNMDYLSPSAANVSMSAALEISRQTKIPVIFTQVLSEVLEGLKAAPSAVKTEDRILWAVDIAGNPHILGTIPDRLVEILDILKDKGRVSASEIAALHGEQNSKKYINKFSVYLQELFNTGLINREKIAGSARDEAGRGWTYVYRPAYADIFETLMKRF